MPQTSQPAGKVDNLALARARTELQGAVFALPVKADLTVGGFVQQDLKLDRGLRLWIRTRAAATATHGDNGACEIEIRVTRDALRQELQRLLQVTAARKLEGAEAISAAINTWPAEIAAVGQVDADELNETHTPNDSATPRGLAEPHGLRELLGADRPVGWEDVTAEGIELTRLGARSSAIEALLEAAGDLKVTNARPLREFLEASGEFREAVLGKISGGANVDVTFAADQVAEAEATAAVKQIIQIVADATAGRDLGDAFRGVDFREMTWLARAKEIRGAGLATPPRAFVSRSWKTMERDERQARELAQAAMGWPAEDAVAPEIASAQETASAQQTASALETASAQEIASAQATGDVQQTANAQEISSAAGGKDGSPELAGGAAAAGSGESGGTTRPVGGGDPKTRTATTRPRTSGGEEKDVESERRTGSTRLATRPADGLASETRSSREEKGTESKTRTSSRDGKAVESEARTSSTRPASQPADRPVARPSGADARDEGRGTWPEWADETLQVVVDAVVPAAWDADSLRGAKAEPAKLALPHEAIDELRSRVRTLYYADGIAVVDVLARRADLNAEVEAYLKRGKIADLKFEIAEENGASRGAPNTSRPAMREGVVTVELPLRGVWEIVRKAGKVERKRQGAATTRPASRAAGG